MASPIMRYFDYSHLPMRLQHIAGPFWALAKEVDVSLPDGAEKSAGLRKLLEAKDCIVRAALDIRPSEADSTGPAEPRPPFQPA